jgi:hypothetical protein
MREIILKRVPKNFSPKQHVLFGMPNFQGAEWAYRDFGQYLEINHDISIEEHRQLGVFTSDYALAQLELWVDILNEIHGTSHSYEFWKVIVYPWLSSVIQVLYERQLMVQTFIEHYKDEPLLLKLVAPGTEVVIKTAYQLLTQICDDATFNWFILSKIFDGNVPSTWRVEYVVGVKVVAIAAPSTSPSLKQMTKSFGLKMLDTLAPRCGNAYGMGVFDRIYISTLLKFKKPLEDLGYLQPLTKDSSWNPQWIFDYGELSKTLLPQEFKTPFVKRYRVGSRGKIRIYSNDLFHNFKSQIKTAFQKEAGEVIIPVQHGGYIVYSGYLEEVVRNIEQKQNFFISWGWIDSQTKNVLPLPSPMLSKLSGLHHERTPKVIFMTTVVRFYKQRFNGGIPSHSIFDYRLERLKFLENLDHRVLDNLFYRPYPESKVNLSDKSFMLNKIPGLKLAQGKSVHKRLLSARLLVMDNPSTTVGIAMAANIPLLIFFKPEHFPFLGEMKTCFDEMEKLGIYHHNAKSAAIFLDSNYYRISDWWLSVEVQNFRKKFANKYARHDQKWRDSWANALAQLN